MLEILANKPKMEFEGTFTKCVECGTSRSESTLTSDWDSTRACCINQIQPKTCSAWWWGGMWNALIYCIQSAIMEFNFVALQVFLICYIFSEILHSISPFWFCTLFFKSTFIYQCLSGKGTSIISIHWQTSCAAFMRMLSLHTQKRSWKGQYFI